MHTVGAITAADHTIDDSPDDDHVLLEAPPGMCVGARDGSILHSVLAFERLSSPAPRLTPTMPEVPALRPLHGVPCTNRHSKYCTEYRARTPPIGTNPFLPWVAVGRRIDADHLVGTGEIAARLGAKTPELVLTWRRRYAHDSDHPFPEPVAKLQMGFVWNWPDVKRWAKATGRPERPAGTGGGTT